MPPESERLSTGEELVLEQFRRGAPVHAYLLTGPRGVGKRTFALKLAQTLFCTAERKPCGECGACKRVLSGAEPDVISVLSQDNKLIPIDRVREVIETVGNQSAGYRAVLIEPVERMTPQAQNCLLKSLEEPVSKVVFLLMSHEASALLGTIASRCCRVKLSPWPDDRMRGTLERLGYADEQIEEALPSAAGNIGHALEQLVQTELGKQTRETVQRILTIENDADVVGASTQLKDDRESAERTLEALEQAIERVLRVRTGQLPPSALKDCPQAWRRAAEIAPISDLTGLVRAVFDTRRYRAGQVNWQSNIDHLLMKLWEAKAQWRQ